MSRSCQLTLETLNPMPKPRKPARHEDASRECAQIILADIERYRGEESLPVEWARRIVAKGGA